MNENENVDKPVLTKEEQFKENPDKFVSLDDIIIAALHTDKGLAIYINPMMRRSEIMRAMGEMQVEIIKGSIKSDAMRSVVKPSGGIIQAARRNLFKR